MLMSVTGEFEVTKLVERKKGAHIILAEASFTLR
jgi:acetamidase/formamidase